eukprot:scaffold123204_cov33-Tisochrysis_lutea.AAC.1
MRRPQLRRTRVPRSLVSAGSQRRRKTRWPQSRQPWRDSVKPMSGGTEAEREDCQRAHRETTERTREGAREGELSAD